MCKLSERQGECGVEDTKKFHLGTVYPALEYTSLLLPLTKFKPIRLKVFKIFLQLHMSFIGTCEHMTQLFADMNIGIQAHRLE
jgi:hypothetical protein